jgi:hypothetical protein
MDGEGKEPITGDFPTDHLSDEELREIPAHVGFDEAWRDAIKQAEKKWHKVGDPKDEIWVKVDYRARVDITNPGGIGHYQVIITPGG